MPADYGRIHRLLKILTLIQGDQGWTADRLAQECQVTQRTIFRDLKMLKGAGIPYFFDETNKCYSIRRDFFMPPVQLTLDEALALSALAEHVGGREQVPFLTPARKAIDKIRSLMPTALRDELQKIDDHLTIHLSPVNPPEASADVYTRVRSALTMKRSLLCEYESQSSRGESKSTKPFVLKPYALHFGERAWYVLGHHSKHQEVRCLKLNRFTRLILSDENYEIPQKFTINQHVGNAWRMIRGKVRHKIELWFDAEFAETISDTRWHSTQDIEDHPDGSITFTCTVDGLEEIVWWILSMGPHCVVKQPRQLADRVRDLARTVARQYEKQATPSG